MQNIAAVFSSVGSGNWPEEYSLPNFVLSSTYTTLLRFSWWCAIASDLASRKHIMFLSLADSIHLRHCEAHAVNGGSEEDECIMHSVVKSFTDNALFGLPGA